MRVDVVRDAVHAQKKLCEGKAKRNEEKAFCHCRAERVACLPCDKHGMGNGAQDVPFAERVGDLILLYNFFFDEDLQHIVLIIQIRPRQMNPTVSART
jgi:hypothetical protein